MFDNQGKREVLTRVSRLPGSVLCHTNVFILFFCVRVESRVKILRKERIGVRLWSASDAFHLLLLAAARKNLWHPDQETTL